MLTSYPNEAPLRRIVRLRVRRSLVALRDADEIILARKLKMRSTDFCVLDQRHGARRPGDCVCGECADKMSGKVPIV